LPTPRETLEAALYLLGRGNNKVKLGELFELLRSIGFEGSVLEELEKLAKEGLIKMSDEEIDITDYGLAQFNKVFAKLLDNEPEAALSLLRAYRFGLTGES